MRNAACKVPMKVPMNHATPDSPLPFPTVAIIGSGFGGLCMAIQLRKAGIGSFTIFEKESSVGGTWRDNTYPGAACDVPSHLYSFSFEPKTDWSRAFPPQPEILAYIEHCVGQYDLRPHIRFNCEIESARFDEGRGLWKIRIKGGQESEAHVLVSACGQLNRPAFPKIAGLSEFKGAQFHSARWNHAHDLTGKSVAVVGTGASAIQFVPPVAKKAKKLYLFQRTPPYVLPKPDRKYTGVERYLFDHFAPMRIAYRNLIYWSLEARFRTLTQGSLLQRYAKWAALRNLRQSVRDSELRKALTPGYPVGCKRILISNDYYEALCRPNVETVTTPIERALPEGIRTRDGREYPVDTIIYGTGFESTHFLSPMKIAGKGGRDLNEAWRDGAEAYLGLAVTGFPNLFMLYGPNTNLGHNSILFMLECQVHYILKCLGRLKGKHLAYLEPCAAPMREYNEKLQERHEHLVWNAGCSSWYKDETGKNTNNWPGYTVEYWMRTRRPDFGAFEGAPRVS